MLIKGIQDEDFVNYKTPSMVISFPFCSFKCDKECGVQVCQNGMLATAPNIEVSTSKIIDRYLQNSITKAIVCAGLEPMDSFDSLLAFITDLRKKIDDDVVIFSGYTEEEIANKTRILSRFKNIVIKFGRFLPNQIKHYDEVLGVYLASDNQYAKRIS